MAYCPNILQHNSWRCSTTHTPLSHTTSGATAERRTPNTPYSIDLFIDDLERLLDRLGIARPTLNCLSLGSMTVQEYVDRHLGQVARANPYESGSVNAADGFTARNETVRPTTAGAHCLARNCGLLSDVSVTAR